MPRPPLPIGAHGRIRITKSPAGTPVATTRYRGFDGKTIEVSRSGATGPKAERALQSYLAEIARTEDTTLADGRVARAVGEWWAEYLETKSPPIGTERRYRSVIDNHILPALGSLTLREARTPRVNAFLRDLTASTSSATASIARAILSGVFKYAVRMGALAVNPVDGCAPISKPASEPTAWTIEQVAAIRARLRAWDSGKDDRGKRVSDLADPSDFMLGTGCRPGETFAVRWEDVNFDSSPPTVRIRATVVKDKDFKTVVQEITKGKRARTLALPPFVVSMLMRRRVASETQYVFPSSTGSVRNPDNFRRQWKNALEGVGASLETFDQLPKLFRSTVATFVAVEAGADSARGQLGHSSVAVTEKHYLANGDVGPDVTKLLERLTENAE